MKRESVNPRDWGLAFDLDQGELVEGARRTLCLVMPELMVEIEAVAAD